MQNHTLKNGLFARVGALFTDHEFIMHTNGKVRFLAISGRLQKRVVIGVCAIISLSLLVTLAMTQSKSNLTGDTTAAAETQAAVNREKRQIAAYNASIEHIAKDLARRQDAIEQITQQFIGDEAAIGPDISDGIVGNDPDTKAARPAKSEKISAAFPEVAILARLEARQIAFAHRLIRVADARTEQAETAIRKLGLNPASLATSPNKAVGGPFIPLFDDGDKQLHPALKRLNTAMLQMDHMESILLTIPSVIPTGSTGISKVTSGFGFRSDPFNGSGAMHSGIDFKGSHGQPILSAAHGVVTYAGWKSGYGKTVEVTHGSGLMSRYAHLSKINVRTGQKIKRGVQVGAMGSTGRSTGTHLHFEVRLNGAAINPQPFLKENTDVLKVQDLARQRATSTKTVRTTRTAYAKNPGSGRG